MPRERDLNIENRREDDCKELLIWNIPNEIRREFKTRCAENEITMREAIIDLMRKYIYHV